VLVENGDSMQRLLSRYMDGAEIVPVASLEESIRELAEAPAQALLINEIDVGEALQRLNKSAGLPYGIPVFVCSVPGAEQAAGDLGVADYLVKPISRDRLLGTLDRMELPGKTVLIADDEPDALQLFWRMLASAGRGYRVLTAMDGHEAMHILRKQHPDVLLLDLVMPDMDGFQLLAAKNEDPVLRSIPTIVISARDPFGQPIVSNALAVTRGGGVSTPELLESIEALSKILGPPGGSDDPGQTARQSG
jgi:CheY-like chemotaxis protein